MSEAYTSIVLDGIIPKHPSDAPKAFGFSLAEWLPSGVTISSVSGTITQENDGGEEHAAQDADYTPPDTITDLSFASVARNSSTFTDMDGETVAVNEGVTGTVSGGSHGILYYVTFLVTLSDSQVLAAVVRFQCSKGYNV